MFSNWFAAFQRPPQACARTGRPVGRAGPEFQRAGPGRAGPKKFRLYTRRLATSHKCVNSHSAVSRAGSCRHWRTATETTRRLVSAVI